MGAALLAAAQRGDALEVERLVKSGARLRYAKSVRACPARAVVLKRWSHILVPPCRVCRTAIAHCTWHLNGVMLRQSRC